MSDDSGQNAQNQGTQNAGETPPGATAGGGAGSRILVGTKINQIAFIESIKGFDMLSSV